MTEFFCRNPGVLKIFPQKDPFDRTWTLFSSGISEKCATRRAEIRKILAPTSDQTPAAPAFSHISARRAPSTHHSFPHVSLRVPLHFLYFFALCFDYYVSLCYYACCFVSNTPSASLEPEWRLCSFVFQN